MFQISLLINHFKKPFSPLNSFHFSSAFPKKDEPVRVRFGAAVFRRRDGRGARVDEHQGLEPEAEGEGNVEGPHREAEAAQENSEEQKIRDRVRKTNNFGLIYVTPKNIEFSVLMLLNLTVLRLKVFEFIIWLLYNQMFLIYPLNV